MRVIITGASGVLGSAVRGAFEQAGHLVLPLSNTRTGNGLVPLDLLSKVDVEARFAEFKPNWVIHCAAERRPDVAAKVRRSHVQADVISDSDFIKPTWLPESRRNANRERYLLSKDGRSSYNCSLGSASTQLNVEVPGHLAALASKLDYTLIYISTGT
jgi:dTDP-4-dehydrorhamnose reductase